MVITRAKFYNRLKTKMEKKNIDLSHIQGFIFDVDGTLADSMEFWHKLGSTYLENQGINPPENVDDCLGSLSFDEGINYLRTTFVPEEEISKVKSDVEKLLERGYLDQFGLKMGAENLICRIARKGRQMCIVTHCPRHLVEAFLETHKIKQYFSFILTEEESKGQKGKGFLFNLALEKLGTKKEKTAVFEDLPIRLKEARELGFITVGVYEKYSNTQEKLKTICQYVVDDYDLVSLGGEIENSNDNSW